ncbi:Asp-tRNA(Asn)/Glu-tRNA(Gln) amidotransferase subunit GatC [Candidatus Woesebacteria bacterium]|nr:Asp-tRNA(Asn)/Glu-tRNA(Gln) amidotransferase subunit GatC [Candidatus Woesebacteria bacterium]QQG47160.1 MAG: Asp-tRNA(Asn)/Glu-tRNA(Gln) amidotransferase subunit GatC [Candidatus Woesebacteria bacterium]
MSKLTINEVDHVAKLAKLTLTPEETKKFQKQLSAVVDYFNELQKVDTTGVEPTSQTTGLLNITRNDEIDVTNILPPKDDYFVVSSILNKNDK